MTSPDHVAHRLVRAEGAIDCADCPMHVERPPDQTDLSQAWNAWTPMTDPRSLRAGFLALLTPSGS